MSGFNMPPGVSPSDIPGNEPNRNPNLPPIAELKAKSGVLTAGEVLDFLLLLRASHPAALKKPLNYAFDGEFNEFSKISFDGETIVLFDWYSYQNA